MSKPKPIPTMGNDDIARFHSYVDRSAGPDACWPWLAGRSSKGYGVFNVSKRQCRANRVAYFLATGRDLGELHALHECDRPDCCNAGHIFLGTNADNMADRNRKGRQAKGESIRGKLTITDVIEIRASGKASEELSTQFGVTSSCINKIRSGKSWRHVQPADVPAICA
jgi:hypothetical protein